MTFKDSRQSWG